MTTSRTTRVLAALVAQVVLLGVAVWAPLSARLTGEEVRLRVEPVDPLDPFRGAYVELGYPDLPDPADRFDPSSDEAPEGPVFVPLRREGDLWVGTTVETRRPDDQPYLACRADWRLTCGIESYFLPQDEAAAVEGSVRDGTVVAVVRVDARGHAALVGLEVR
ncbi:GDYXXLXY domain-containing protein [Phycicoccus sp. CSK15P-2]|uniref:GDYXXLXY domain-containing protein n=1 Tax=Phycicoccus sp. CSK15P-2 TaxID=2807627 RepID=UPI001950DBE0|nr:GDYXXLXY domain-containing protein [Phycicoccus sp. CSK15P-2]MBM6402911.1 GDYXXLXY domain-containing protein [Phycicoccus sp. CSK15P-2]